MTIYELDTGRVSLKNETGETENGRNARRRERPRSRRRKIARTVGGGVEKDGRVRGGGEWNRDAI